MDKNAKSSVGQLACRGLNCEQQFWSKKLYSKRALPTLTYAAEMTKPD